MVILLPVTIFAQTVTVDNTDSSPDNVSTFDSIMMALHSFQSEGAVVASTDGSGVGVNNGNSIPNVIEIVGTGTVYDEIVRIDERSASGGYCVLNEDLVIKGIAGAEDKPIVAPNDDGGNDDDAFEIRTDVNLEIRNIVFMWDPDYPDGSTYGVYLMTLDLLNTTSGSPSTMLVKDCVFTGADASGQPLVTNKDEALINRISDYVPPAGGEPGRTLGIFPDQDEGLIATVEDCVFSHASQLDSSRAAQILVFFGGIGSSWTEEVGADIKSCIISFNAGPGVEMQSGGNSNDAALQYVNITGTGAKAGGIASGEPTIIYNQGNASLPGNGAGLFMFDSSNDTAFTADLNNVWMINLTGRAIQGNVMGGGDNGFWSLDDSLILNTNTQSGTSAIMSGWRSVTPTAPSTLSITDSTIISGNSSTEDDGAVINLLGDTAMDNALTLNMDNVILGKSRTAAGTLNGILNEGPVTVNVTDSVIIESGSFAIDGTSALNTGTGAINQTNVLNVDPQLKYFVPMNDVEYYAVMNQSLAAAQSGGEDLDGGRIIGTPPTNAHNWNMYE